MLAIRTERYQAKSCYTYAQDRYKTLTECPEQAIADFLDKGVFTPEKKAQDRAVRFLISCKLSYEYEQITAEY